MTIRAPRTPTARPLGAVVRALPALVIVAIAAAGPWLAPHAPKQATAMPYDTATGALGTDQLGRDVLSRLLTGGGGLLVIATIIAVLVTGLAAFAGIIAALRPRVGALLERTTDLLMLVPPVLAIMLFMLSWPESGATGLILLAVVIGTPYTARVVAAAASNVAASGYVEAAMAGGESLWSLTWREVLPNLRNTLVTLFGLRFVEAVYVVSTAAFLQLPTSLGSSNWALMIRENAPGILLNPWAVLAPGLAMGLLAISVNLAMSALAPRELGAAA